MNIVDTIGLPAVLEQLAEECCELGQAALKLSRILRRENPTPVSIEVAQFDFAVEAGDVPSFLISCGAMVSALPIVSRKTTK